MNRSVLPASCRQKKLGSADETSAARCSGVRLALRWFMAPMRVQSWKLRLPTNRHRASSVPVRKYSTTVLIALYCKVTDRRSLGDVQNISRYFACRVC